MVGRKCSCYCCILSSLYSPRSLSHKTKIPYIWYEYGWKQTWRFCYYTLLIANNIQSEFCKGNSLYGHACRMAPSSHVTMFADNILVSRSSLSVLSSVIVVSMTFSRLITSLTRLTVKTKKNIIIVACSHRLVRFKIIIKQIKYPTRY